MAIAAATIAICSGVARTSNCPIADSAVCGRSGSSGKRLATLRIGTSNAWSKPNFSAWARSASSPRSSPSLPKATLQEFSSATVRVALPAGARAAVLVRQHGRRLRQVELRGVVDLGLSGVYLPLSSAAAEVTSLKVEPGG